MFTDDSAALGIATGSVGTGAAWADYDNDGFIDLYITNTSGTNWLYHNDSGTAFTNVAATAGVGSGGAGRGVAWGDYDNDGDLDLATISYTSSLLLYSNNGDGTFANIASTVGAGLTGSVFQAAWADYDRDGDLDLYVGKVDAGGNHFLVSAGGANSWLAVTLVGSTDNRKGVGAVVAATVGGITQMRAVDGGTGLTSQDSLPVEFGLGVASAVDTLTVQWPSGSTDVLMNVAANQMITVTQGGTETPPTVAITAPTPDQILAAGTTSTPLTVAITDHAAPGHWHWQLDAPFPDTGVAAGDHVDPGVLTDTISDLVDGGAHTVYVALVADAAHSLVDATINAGARASVSFSVDTLTGSATVSVVTPTEGQELPPGTGTTTLSVDVTDHAAGTWAWRLDTAFPDTGAVPGDANPVASGSIAGIGGLVDGASHTVYVALVDGDLVDATVEPASRASAAFSVGILPTEFVRVVSKQGGAGTTTAIPIEVYAVPVDTVTGVDLDLHYDETILTPTSDAGVLSAVTINATLVPADWVILQNISSTGVLSVSLASAFANALTGGEILSVAFDVAVGAIAGTQTPLTLTGVRLNEDEVDSTGVAGLFTVLNVVYGDVTGDGTISAYDASWVLEWVANDLAGTPIVFPIEENAPMWASLPLTGPEALEVADVDDDGFITAMDASDILRKRVGIIDLFVAEGGAPSAPSSAPGAAVYSLRGLALSERPGAQVTVTLDASAMADLYGGELVLDFDPSLLRPVDVALRRHDARDAMQRPLLTQSEGDGRLAVAFASARPIEASDALLEVTFEATRDISHARESAIRASHLRLNRSKIETDFAFPFRVEPFANRLMANYPNPFNPETWIPFELAADSHVEVRVYGLDGSVVRTVELGRRAIGEYRTRDEAAYWDGRNESGEHVASGVYVYELVAGAHRSVRRMTVLK